MLRDVLPGTRARRPPAGLRLPFLLAVLSVPFLSGAPEGAMVGGKHDFVDNGFTGGGVCGECHIPHGAADSRLWPRAGDTTTYPNAPARLCMDCHDGSMPVGPANPGWPAVWTGAQPPDPGCHGADPANGNCTSCHSHQSGFRAEPSSPPAGCEGCFCCHTNPPGAIGALDADSWFDGVGLIQSGSVLSQHNIAASGECRKCHGPGHPSDACFLTYADSVTGGVVNDGTNPVGTHNLGQVIAKSSSMEDYQDFCLACHDGKDESASPIPDTTFTGPLGTNQVAPSCPDDPELLQDDSLGACTGDHPPWGVPAVPAKNSAGDVTQPPYFAFYETNGHGADTALISSSPMNVTCLAGGAGQGCHSAHGSQNRYLIDDSFGTGIDSATEFGTGVCYACHVVGVNFGDSGSVSMFHNWFGNNTVLHDDATNHPPTDPATTDAMSRMRIFSGNMNVSSFVTAAGAMPFYEGNAEDNKIDLRHYRGLLSGSDWVHCLTCHDPHGTGPGGTGTLPPDEPGMLRRFTSTYGYDDSLCGQCHIR